MLLVAVVCVFSSCKEYILLPPPHCHGGEAGSSATVDVEVNIPEDYTGPVPEMPKLMPDANNMIQRPSPSAMPVIPGMLFQDIYEDPECTIPVNFPVPYSENQKYYARYVPETPSVRFLAVLYPGNTGEEVTLPEGITAEEGDEINPVDYTASATGYKFVAWYNDRNCTEVATTFNAKPGETTLYAMLVQSEVEMTEGPNGEEIIPITYTAVVDDPTDVHYEVQSISGGDEDLYIINTINGFPVDIADSAAVSKDFTRNVNISVRNIGDYAFSSSEFGEANEKRDYTYTFNILSVDGKGGDIGFDAFNSVKFATQSDGGLMKFTMNQDGVIENGGIGFTLVDRGKSDAEITLNLGELGAGGASGLVIGSRCSNNTITANITIAKAADQAFSSGAIFFDRCGEGFSGNLTMTINECGPETMYNTTFGAGVDLEDGSVVNISLYGPESDEKGAQYFTPEYILEDLSGWLHIEECSTFLVNEENIL